MTMLGILSTNQEHFEYYYYCYYLMLNRVFSLMNLVLNVENLITYPKLVIMSIIVEQCVRMAFIHKINSSK